MADKARNNFLTYIVAVSSRILSANYPGSGSHVLVDTGFGTMRIKLNGAARPSEASDDTQKDNIHPWIQFLHSQSQTSLHRLYSRPSSCLAIFRLLNVVERHVIMCLLWLEASIPADRLSAWATKAGRKQYDAAIRSLSRMHILATISSVIPKLMLNQHFKGSLRAALTGGGAQMSFGIPASKDKEKEKEGDKRSAMTVEQLDWHAVERWETILLYMVTSGSGSASQRPSQGVLLLLQRSGLMSDPTNGQQITSKGFQFLLYTPHEQLWDLLLQYLHMAEERQMDLVEVLSFLFMLSTSEVGRDYSVEQLTPTQLAMLEDLRDYGLVWQRKSSSRRFYPTRLATTLTSSLPALPASSKGGSGEDGFVILETNYRLYAYTDNPLQISVLNLFASLRARFPNLVVGTITRDSIRKALSNGIRADQIIAYLTAHAHPQMRKNNPLIPVTVQDQIRLWELEKDRLKGAEGYLYKDFAAQADYKVVLDYAQQMGVVLWENSAKRMFFTKMEGHGIIKAFIDRRTRGDT